MAQTAWLQRGTIRENIVWGAPFDEQRYEQVLMSCALIDDLQALGGDQTGVGEGGKTLSGGQRARLSLARAVYQDKEGVSSDEYISLMASVSNMFFSVSFGRHSLGAGLASCCTRCSSLRTRYAEQ